MPGASLNAYLEGHRVKLQVDYRRLWNNTQAQGQDDNQVRMQLQMFF